jgi:hypothetical protein
MLKEFNQANLHDLSKFTHCFFMNKIEQNETWLKCQNMTLRVLSATLKSSSGRRKKEEGVTRPIFQHISVGSVVHFIHIFPMVMNGNIFIFYTVFFNMHILLICNMIKSTRIALTLFPETGYRWRFPGLTRSNPHSCIARPLLADIYISLDDGNVRS